MAGCAWEALAPAGILDAGLPTCAQFATLRLVTKVASSIRSRSSIMKSLTFQNTQFNIVDHNNKRWLSAADIACALNYAREDAVSRIYERNSDEFTDEMTETVKLTASGNYQKTVRIFSLRGAHLIAMFSRTKVAKEFRKWVLDVLDKEVQQPAPTAEVKTLPSPLTTEQQSVIKDLVKSRVEILPPSKQAKAAITCWSALKSKFGCSYKQIDSEQFSDAVSLVARITLEGEFLGKEELKRLDINFPIESLLVSRRSGMLTPRNKNTDFLAITLNDLREFHTSPCEDLLNVLANEGYNIDAAWYEMRTYRNKLAYLMPLLDSLRAVAIEPQQYVVDKTDNQS